MVKSTQR